MGSRGSSCTALLGALNVIRPYSTSNLTKVCLKLYYGGSSVHCVVQDNEEQLFGYEVTVQRKWLGSSTGLYPAQISTSREPTVLAFYAGPWLKFIVGVKLMQTGNLQKNFRFAKSLFTFNLLATFQPPIYQEAVKAFNHINCTHLYMYICTC